MSTKYNTPLYFISLFSGTNPCLYVGVLYASGAEFPASDGCNECECVGGVTTCSTDVCEGAPGSSLAMSFIL